MPDTDVVSPAPTLSPEEPDEPEPTIKLIAPPRPAVAPPVCKITDPLVPENVVPELMTMSPLVAPVCTAFAVNNFSDPEDDA